MKPWTSVPEAEVRVFKPDPKVEHYEVWYIEPVFVGKVDKLGVKHVVTDDKQRFSNIFLAARHLLERAGKGAMAEKIGGIIRVSPRRNRPFTGRELADLDVWGKFRAMRKLSGPSTDMDFTRMWALTPEECAQLGLPGGEEAP